MPDDAVVRNRERYDRALALLDGVREQVEALLRSVDREQVDRRPSEPEWSLGEIADHLANTERAYVGVVADLAANATPHAYDYRQVLRERPFRIEDTWDVAVTGKLATPPELLPARGKPLEALLMELRRAREESRQVLAPYRDQDLGVRFFVHPRLGTMTLYERLEQLAYHELKHLRQMERVLARLHGTA